MDKPKTIECSLNNQVLQVTFYQSNIYYDCQGSRSSTETKTLRNGYCSDKFTHGIQVLKSLKDSSLAGINFPKIDTSRIQENEEQFYKCCYGEISFNQAQIRQHTFRSDSFSSYIYNRGDSLTLNDMILLYKQFVQTLETLHKNGVAYGKYILKCVRI